MSDIRDPSEAPAHTQLAEPGPAPEDLLSSLFHRPACAYGDGVGQTAVPAPLLHSVLVLPGRQKLQLVYGASYGPLRRKYVPGVHARIPLARRIDDDPPIAYECPPTIGEAYRDQQKACAP